MILTRDQFIDHWNKIKSGFGGIGSPIWAPERDTDLQFIKFLNLRPNTIFDIDISNSMSEWCNKNCKGMVRCFASNSTEEWWGFTNEDDILLWLLKWT